MLDSHRIQRNALNSRPEKQLQYEVENKDVAGGSLLRNLLFISCMAFSGFLIGSMLTISSQPRLQQSTLIPSSLNSTFEYAPKRVLETSDDDDDYDDDDQGTEQIVAPSSPSPKIYNQLDNDTSCDIIKPKLRASRRFDIVLLSTFPRSGNTWTKSLIASTTRIQYELTTVQMKPLKKLFKMSECMDCDELDLAKYFEKVLNGKIWNGGLTRVLSRKLKGVGVHKEATVEGRCAEAKGAQRFVKGDRVEPVYVKSHFPEIGDKEVEDFILSATKILHLSRNPIDNIASRYMGNHLMFQKRYNEQIKAVKKGKSTAEFDKWLPIQIQKYVDFHEYWLKRSKMDKIRGAETMFLRYESLCLNTEAMLYNMLKFGGWDIPKDSIEFQCAMNYLSCEYDSKGFPKHKDLFLKKHVELIVEKTKPILDQYGYYFTPKLQLELRQAKIPICG
eukprot:m.144500 g.144500  ORF g.144500 m.144500 type:complete len:446 (-) comp14923_c0_seq12:1399-2736(-)